MQDRERVNTSEEMPSTSAGVRMVIDQSLMKFASENVPVEPSVVMVPENPKGEPSNGVPGTRRVDADRAQDAEYENRSTNQQ